MLIVAVILNGALMIGSKSHSHAAAALGVSALLAAHRPSDHDERDPSESW